MTMNKIILLIFLVTTSSLFAQGDRKQARAERELKIEEARIAFITKELNLSSEKSEKFWPVYNAYSVERKAIMKEMRKLKRSAKQQGELLTDDRALVLINKRLENEEKMLNLNKSYKNQFLAVISPTEFLKLYKAEKKFLRWLREKSDLKGKQGHRGNGGHGPNQG